MGSERGEAMRPTILAIGTVGALLFLGASCDGDMTPVEAADAGGELDSFNNVNGYCSAQPASCDDLVQDGDDEPTSCCFGSQIYNCEGGTLLYRDCSGGCTNSSSGVLFCSSSGGSSADQGGWSEPPTDPGPGF
jgi:hypothetical protein